MKPMKLAIPLDVLYVPWMLAPITVGLKRPERVAVCSLGA
jgi:hypothetical protein